MNYNRYVFAYKGYKYCPWEDIEEDNRKIFHDVVTPRGTLLEIRLSPYTACTKEMFEKFVDEIEKEKTK